MRRAEFRHRRLRARHRPHRLRRHRLDAQSDRRVRHVVQWRLRRAGPRQRLMRSRAPTAAIATAATADDDQRSLLRPRRPRARERSTSAVALSWAASPTPTASTCTATLVARDVIVTAAHCISHRKRRSTTRRRVRAPTAAATRARSPIWSTRTSTIAASPQRTRSTAWIGRCCASTSRWATRWAMPACAIITGQGLAAARAADLYQAGYSWDTGDTSPATSAAT